MVTYFRSTFTILTLLAASNGGGYAAYHPAQVYVSDYCNKELLVNEDVIISSTNVTVIPSHVQCSMTLRAPSDSPNSRLVAKFLKYNLNANYISEGGVCTFESIQMTSDTKPFFGNKGYCGSGQPSGQFILGDRGTFGYTTFDNVVFQPANVQLLVTLIQQKNDDGTCPTDLFDCQYGSNCLHQELLCNGVDDCGNNKDEDVGCADLAGLNTIWISSIVIAVICVIASIIFVVVLVRAAVRKCNKPPGMYVQI